MTALANNLGQIAMALKVAIPWLVLWFLSLGGVGAGLFWWFQDPDRRENFDAMVRILNVLVVAGMIGSACLLITLQEPVALARWKLSPGSSPPRQAYLERSRPNPVAGLEGDPYPLLGILTLALSLFGRGISSQKFLRGRAMVLGSALLVIFGAQGFFLFNALSMSDHLKH